MITLSAAKKLFVKPPVLTWRRRDAEKTQRNSGGNRLAFPLRTSAALRLCVNVGAWQMTYLRLIKGSQLASVAQFSEIQ